MPRINDPSIFWAKFYNAEHAQEEGETAQTRKLLEKAEQYNRMRNLPVHPQMDQAIRGVVESGVFDAEMGASKIEKGEVYNLLKDVSKVESAGGRMNKPSPTGAAGFLQVTNGTFKDLIKRGVVGPKAQKYLGKSKKELLNMSNDERKKYLTTDHKAAAVFGAGAYLNKLNGLTKELGLNE